MARYLLCTLAGAASLLMASSLLPAPHAAPFNAAQTAPAATNQIEKAQLGIYVDVGRPYRPYRPYYDGYYRPYYGDRPYYRPYYAPPPVRYYETRPYVVARPALPYRDPDAVARCASRFRSFNVHTGTYVTYDGEERLCPYLR